MLGLFKYSEKNLASDIIKQMKQQYDDPVCEYKPDTREVTFCEKGCGEEGTAIIFLGNLYNKVKNLAKNERMETIQRFLESVLGQETFNGERLLDSLLLRARTPFEISIRELYSERHNQLAISSVIYGEGEAFFELVADSEDMLAIVMQADLSNANVSEEEAFKIAASRLYRMTDASQWSKVDNQVWISSYQDDYDFSRLLSNRQHNQFPFHESPIIFSPSHSICLVSNSRDNQLLEKLINDGNQLAVEHRPFSQLLWTAQVDGHIAPLKPSGDHSLDAIIQLQEIRELASQYDEQKNIFNEMLRENNQDIFVASYEAKSSDGVLTTYCVYSLDVSSYLPKTDRVVIVDPFNPDEKFNVWGDIPWETFLIVVNDNIRLMPNIIPECYALLEPLSENQKTALKAAI